MSIQQEEEEEEEEAQQKEATSQNLIIEKFIKKDVTQSYDQQINVKEHDFF
jgi:hypothetical protein